MKAQIFTTTLLLLLCCSWATSQTSSAYDNIVKKAPYIFEGKFISRVYFVREKNGINQAFTANKVQIFQIYRGGKTLKKGTINIITQGGLKESNGITFKTPISPHGREFTGNGIYFCFPVTNKAMGGEYPSTGRIIEVKGNPTSITADNTVSVKSLAVIHFSTMAGLDRKFGNRQGIDEFLSKQDNIKMPKKEKISSEPKKVDEQPETAPSKKKMF